MTDQLPTEIVGSCPLDCPDACSWLVTVDRSGPGPAKAVRLRGNPDHPFTDGALCKKVNPWLDYAADPARVLHPMRRVGAKGAGLFERVSWNDALAEMAERFQAVIDNHGPEAIWPFAGTGNVGFLQGGAAPAGARLWHHLGVSGHDVTICSVSGHVGLGYSLGTSASMDPEDIVDAGLIMIWASNTLIANRHLWPFVEKARAKGVPIVVIDPMRTRTAARADLHLAPRPGTDGALALGLMRAVMERGGADERFLSERTTGWDEFRPVVDAWTPERAAEVCGLRPDEITGLAAMLVDHAPLALKIGQGVQRHANGGQAARTLGCLPAVTGAYDQSGGGLIYSTSGAYGLNVDPSIVDPPPGGGARPVRRLAMTAMADNLLRLDDPPVDAIIIHGANPVVSNPDTEAVRQGLSRPDLFTVSIELFPTETTDYADLILPSAMQHEQYEMNDSFSHLYLNWNEPAVDPPGECLAHTEIFRRVARAMGLDDPALQADDLALAASLLDTPAYHKAGITLDELRAAGWIRLPATEAPFRPVAEGFATASGRFEFVSEQAEADGHGRLPIYRGPSEVAGSEAGRYALVAAASDWHVNSTFAGTATTTSRTARPKVVIHPLDAVADGLTDGCTVELANDRGSFTAQIQLDDGVRRGVAYTVKGWWAMGVNATVAELDSDMGRGAVFHDNLVTITPQF